MVSRGIIKRVCPLSFEWSRKVLYVASQSFTEFNCSATATQNTAKQQQQRIISFVDIERHIIS